MIPVLVIDDLDHARPLAEALVKGGLPVLEVTLRTPVALEAIRIMAEVDGGVVGAGTLLKPSDVKAAVKAGAKFGVSRRDQEARRGLRGRGPAAAGRHRHRHRGDADAGARLRGLQVLPAEANGGAKALKSFAGLLPQVSFCPTGGVTPRTRPTT